MASVEEYGVRDHEFDGGVVFGGAEVFHDEGEAFFDWVVVGMRINERFQVICSHQRFLHGFGNHANIALAPLLLIGLQDVVLKWLLLLKLLNHVLIGSVAIIGLEGGGPLASDFETLAACVFEFFVFLIGFV